MLRELSVQNLALIEDVQVELDEGFCAWTGETGAGKSLLLTALGLVLGGKASADLVRAGKKEARAAAVFVVEDDALRSELEGILGGSVDEDGADHHAPGLGAGAELGPGERDARDDRHPPAAGRAPGGYPRPERGAGTARSRTPARAARRLRRPGRAAGGVSPGQRPRTTSCGRGGRPSSTRPRRGRGSGRCSSSSATSWPRPIPGWASTTSSFGSRTCWPMPRRCGRRPREATTSFTRPIIPPRSCSSGWRAPSSPWRTRCPSWPSPSRPCSGSPTRLARWPTDSASSGSGGMMTLRGSRRSRPGWRSTGGWPRGSGSPPTSSRHG